MNMFLKLMPVKVLIKLVLDILKYIASKTKNTKDDQILQAMIDIYDMVQPYVPQKRKK